MIAHVAETGENQGRVVLQLGSAHPSAIALEAAVRIARAGNLDFSMIIAFNSGLQVALAGTAIAVAAGAVLGHQVLIVFPPIELALLGAATIMTAILTSIGRANWLEGLELLAIYVIAALAFWYL